MLLVLDYTHLNHGLLVSNSPPRLLGVIVDRDDGMEIGRVWIDFPTDVFGLKLRLKCQFRSPQLCVQFRHDAKSLFVSRTVFTGASGSLLCSAKRRLHLLFLLRVRETPSGSSCAGDSQQAFRSIRCRTASDLNLEVSKRHVVPFFLLRSDLSGGLFVFWFTIGFTLCPFTGISFLVEFVQTFTSESRSRGLSFARLDLLEETYAEQTNDESSMLHKMRNPTHHWRVPLALKVSRRYSLSEHGRCQLNIGLAPG